MKLSLISLILSVLFVVTGAITAFAYWRFRSRFKLLYPVEWQLAHKQTVFDGYNGFWDEAAILRSHIQKPDRILMAQLKRTEMLFKILGILLALFLFCVLF